ncbi:hypothetical protein EDD85DRAFT_792385 [Armillaria nabsnona]|nr:hypothetical protein EDD85DRAFT_792385 [Armillaria nabsnona]
MFLSSMRYMMATRSGTRLQRSNDREPLNKIHGIGLKSGMEVTSYGETLLNWDTLLPLDMIAIPHHTASIDWILQDFHLHTLTSKKSLYDYIEAVKRQENNAFPQDCLDVYWQFVHVQRIWVALTMKKRSGQAHGINKHFPQCPAGFVMSTGFNVSDLIMDSVSEKMIGRHLVQFTFMQDGHFGLQIFQKVDDPDNISIVMGTVFFPMDKAYNKYIEKVVATSDEFNAVEMQNKMKFKGCVITGVIAIECGQHCIFILMVDLHKGEWFANMDFCLAFALSQYTNEQSLKAAKYFCQIILTYDIACQYYTKLKECFTKCFLQISDIVNIINCLGAGENHGEGIEQSWAESKQSGGSIRQMNHRHRHDKLNNYHNFWNWCKVQKMSESLFNNIIKGHEQLSKIVDYFLGLCIMQGKATVNSWKEESTEPTWNEKTKQWESPYCLNMQKHMFPTQAEVFTSLLEQEQVIDQKSMDAYKKNLAIHCVDTGIKLQTKQCKLAAAIRKGEMLPEEIRVAHHNLLAKIRCYRKTQLQQMPDLGDIIAARKEDDKEEKENVEVENEVLFLPSDLAQSEIQIGGLKKFADIKYKLQEGQANEAIMMLSNSIIHCMLLNDTSHIMLLQLSDTEELQDFPKLESSDLYIKNAAGARGLGEGSITDSWIWTYGRLKGMSDADKNDFHHAKAFKVQWFQACADMDQWIEEVEILEEEFCHFIWACDKMSQIWKDLSKEHPKHHLSVAGHRVYVMEKLMIYWTMAQRVREAFAECGGGWPQRDEDLSSYIEGQRPATDVDWEAVEKES